MERDRKIRHATQHPLARRATTATTVPLARGLSTKLLLLTVLFVMIAEVLIFLPSIANFKLRWLEERLGTAAAVSVVLLVQDDPEACPAPRRTTC